MSFHSQELTLRKDTRDQQGECRALGHLAAVHMALGDYSTTFQCYEAQLSLAQGLRDTRLEAQVHGNMGITKLNMGVFEEAIGYFEQQLAMLQQLSGTESLLDRGRAYGNLADCYDALGDYEEAIQYYEKYLTTAQSLNHIQDQEKAYRGLGNAHRYRARLLRHINRPMNVCLMLNNDRIRICARKSSLDHVQSQSRTHFRGEGAESDFINYQTTEFIIAFSKVG